MKGALLKSSNCDRAIAISVLSQLSFSLGSLPKSPVNDFFNLVRVSRYWRRLYVIIWVVLRIILGPPHGVHHHHPETFAFNHCAEA